MLMRTQPKGLFRIANTPLAAGLRMAVLPGANRNYNAATGKQLTPNGIKPTGFSTSISGGFGSTYGLGTSDKIVTDLGGAFPASGRTYFFRVRKNSAGGGSLGRLFDKTNGTAGQYFYVSASNLAYTEYWNGAERACNVAVPANGAWFDVLVTSTYSGSVHSFYLYLNGAYGAGEGPITIPGGVFTDAASTPLTIGNRNSDNARCWDGLIECAYAWDRVLLADEITALSVNPYQIFAAPDDEDDLFMASANPGISGTFGGSTSSDMAASGLLTNMGAFSAQMADAVQASGGQVGANPSGTLSNTLDGAGMASNGLQNNRGSLATALSGVGMNASGGAYANPAGPLNTTMSDAFMSAYDTQPGGGQAGATNYRRRAPHRLVN